jgi:serine/threonine protein kinase
MLAENYEIDYVLGKGGFGITYKAIDHNLQRYVAIKEFFPSEWAWRSKGSQSVSVSKSNHDIYQKLLLKFETEGRILAKLQHRSIVRVYSLFRSFETVYLVMELLEGRTLHDEIASKCLEKNDIEKIAKTLAIALNKVHKMGIQHLDIKPDNIMLTNDGRIVLYDFGAARCNMDQVRRSQTITAYTPGYAPLELLQSHRATTSPATDIYQLSVVIYEMLTGERPPDPLQRLNMAEPWEPEVPEPWRKLLKAGLALRLADRPQSVSQWWKLYQPSQPQDNLKKGESFHKFINFLNSSLKINWLGLLLVSTSLLLGGVLIFQLNARPYYEFMANRAKARGDYENAVSYYNALISQTPNDIKARLARAEANVRLRKYLNAINDYEYVHSINNDSSLLRKIGQAYFQQGELDESQRMIDSALGHYQKAKSYDANLVNAVNSKMLDVLSLSAKIQLEKGEYQNAIELYNKLLQEYSPDTAISKSVRQSLSLAYLQLGNQQEKEGELENALASYTSGLEKNPNSSELYEARGTLLIKLDQLNSALTDYNRSIELNKKAMISYAGRAYILGTFGQYQNALGDYNQAISLGLKTDYVYYGRGWLHEQLSQYSKAILDYNQAIAINSEHLLSYVRRGWVKYRMSDYGGAIKDFDTVLEKDDTIASAHQGLGYAKTMVNDSKKVINEHLQTAIKLYTKEKNEEKILEIKEWMKQHKLRGR